MKNKFSNILKKGFTSFYHSVTMQGSQANLSDRQRRAKVLNIMADDTLSNIDSVDRGADLERFQVFPQDQLMNGNFYPILFDPDKTLGKLKDEIPAITTI